MRKVLATLCADLFFVWVLVHFGLGSLADLWRLLAYAGPAGWAVLCGVLFLLLLRSDYRSDLPLFAAGVLLGYWGEWWGTTRGVWTYWNGATPPTYLPPLWGIGLLTVFRLGRGRVEGQLCGPTRPGLRPQLAVAGWGGLDWPPGSTARRRCAGGLYPDPGKVRPAPGVPPVPVRDAAGRAVRDPGHTLRRMALHHR